MTDYQPHPIEWTPEKIGRLWTYYATNRAYDATYFSRHSGRSILRFVEGVVPLTGREVLDFGCGRGDMLGHLLDSGVRCRGIEFSAHSATEARLRFEGRDGFGGVAHATDRPLPEVDDSVEIVFLIEVLEHLFEDDLAPILADIFRILRPGGHLIATTPHAEDLGANCVHCPDCGSTFHRWQHMRSITIGQMSAWMGAAGLEEIYCDSLRFEPPRSLLGRLLAYARAGRDRLARRVPPSPHLAFVGRKPGPPLDSCP